MSGRVRVATRTFTVAGCRPCLWVPVRDRLDAQAVLMSNVAPVTDSLAKKLASLHAAATAVEQLAAEYLSAIRPEWDAIQAVADATRADRMQLNVAVMQLRGLLPGNGSGDTLTELVNAPVWTRMYNEGQPGRAIAGQTFSAALVNCEMGEYYAVLDKPGLVREADAVGEVCGVVLTYLLVTHLNRHTPQYAERYGAILTSAAMDGDTLAERLTQCCVEVSHAARRAMRLWKGYSSGGFYGVDIRPADDLPEANDEAGNAEGGSPQSGGPPTRPTINLHIPVVAGTGTQQREGEKPKPVDEPDGPFGTDGFRFAGAEVRFGRAAKQYGLVLALWNSNTNEPAGPRLVQDVITDVWGEENETEDDTFRQLCAETRGRFQKAACPLEIRALQGKVQLVRV